MLYYCNMRKTSSLLISLAIVAMTVPPVQAASKPSKPSITAISSSPAKNGLVNLTVSIALGSSAGGTSAITGTKITAGKKFCTAKKTSKFCTIKGLKAGTAVSVSAVSQAKQGNSPRSKVINYKVGSKKYTANSSVTKGQANAKKSAASYLSFMSFSRSGLIRQLESEGYSTADATYGVDAQNADWNAQATKSAKTYLDLMSFSRSGLIALLESEGFTNAEAIYGANKNGYVETLPSTPVVSAPVTPSQPSCTSGIASQCNAFRSAADYLRLMAFSRSGLIRQLEFEGYSTADATYGVDAQNADWNAQATKSAKSYLDLMPFSRSGLIAQLEFEGFTRAQATFGVAANGL